ncbi:hypothetical protein F4818DRAFT_417312 [Hypoxylon cercidicola]|nr:hypothetical protein F4818DRAFT_417312 [Hypoxylon cercidicola]
MGGLVFSSGPSPLFTPRMDPAIYKYIRDFCCTKLREPFVVVVSPIPGPAKKDYGDIDIFVAWERDVVFSSSTRTDRRKSLLPTDGPLTVAVDLFHPERTIKTRATGLTMAVPWPAALPKEIAGSDGADHGDASNPRYIQVDLRLFDSLEQLQWLLFKNAHGDMWGILGSIIRPFGLFIDDHALHIRILEMEATYPKLATVLLTKDPSEVLDFLGLKQDRAQWEEPFASTEDLFEYAATCRLFSTSTRALERSNIKPSDRRRLDKRHNFRKYLDEFIPAMRQAGRYATVSATRDSVRAEAFERFPGARHAYEARLMDLRKEKQSQALWRCVIKAAIPPSDNDQQAYKHWRSNLAKALKKIIMQDDDSLGVRPATPLRDSDGLYDEDRVRQFVADTWQEVGRLAWKENQEKYAAKLAAQKSAKGDSSDESLSIEDLKRMDLGDKKAG